MKFTGGPNSRRGLFAAALTLFAFAAIAPSEAQATCGDYVMLGTHSHAAVKQKFPKFRGAGAAGPLARMATILHCRSFRGSR
jgi:hypothetical protein